MLLRAVIVAHRWLGVVLCLLFLLWFPTGIAMMYWDFPSVSAADRLARSSSLSPSSIVLSPAEAWARLHVTDIPSGIRLNLFDGRPVYRFRFGDGDALVYADTGEEQVDVPRVMVDRVAEAWTRQPVGAARVEALGAVDQWTVQGRLSDLAPLWKFSWPDGEQVYVSQASGEVVQYTTPASRLGAYVGAIPHWLYFTPLRSRGQLWSQVVIWASGIGACLAVLGVVIAVARVSPSKRYRRNGVPAALPYRGQKRWHAVLGLTFGIAAITWTASGLLSMEPFPTGDDGPPPPASAAARIPEALRGQTDPAAFSPLPPRDALARLAGAGVSQLDLASVGGAPVYVATLTGGGTRVVGMDGVVRAGFDPRHVIDVVAAAAQPEGLAGVDVVDRYDAYYLDRRSRKPLPVIVARLKDPRHSRYYIDPATARVVGAYNTGNWVSRWLYHGLHSLDFPWLYNSRPLWDVLVIACMAGGTALSVTSLVLAWRAVGRTLAAAASPGAIGAGLADDADGA